MAPLSKTTSGTSPVIVRAQATAAVLSEHLGKFPCAVIVGPSHSGKTQTAMAALKALDPTGNSTVHTSAAILNYNAPIAPQDRSAHWQSWTDIIDRFADDAPQCVVIDEAGSSSAPLQPLGFEVMRARALLKKWKDAGTTFVVIGHQRSEALDSWSSWLSAGQPLALVDAARGSVHLGQTELRVSERRTNPVADKNELGAQGRESMHKPLGNALFVRFESDDDDHGG